MWSIFSRDPTKDFSYDVGDPINFSSQRSFWKLHKGKKKGSGQEVTIFILEYKNASSAEIDAAKTAVKRLKTLKHPNVLSFYDSVETDKCIYLATERVIPLEKYLQENAFQQGDLAVSWGLFQITRAVSFLNNDGNLKHNCINVGSVFVDGAGEWKLGGLEFVSGETAETIVKVPAYLTQLDPPEHKNGVNSRSSSKWSTDAWGLGVLIWEVFNGLTQAVSMTGLKNLTKIPKSLRPIYAELTNENPAIRPNPADVILKGRKPGCVFKNDLIDALLFLEEIQIKETSDKAKFFNSLVSMLDRFPPEICRHKILPQLLNAFEFGNVGSTILGPLLNLGKLLDEQEYQAKIVPCVVKLFSSPDRATRVRLLQSLENFADHLQPATVNDQIFPNIVQGFADSNATVREQTVKAMLYLAPKLNNNNLNTELLKHFARLQKDCEGGIRTNTTICLGKIACYLNPQTRRRVLIPAFTRVFVDSFPQARVAAVLGIASTQQYHVLTDVAQKIIPALSGLTIDPDKIVRDNAFKTIKGFLGKLEKLSDDPSLKDKLEAEIDANTTTTDSASSWAGWAVALTSKFHRSPSQQSSTGNIGQGANTTMTTTTNKGRYALGGQSSSSTSTTTSSIPSTPSVDRDVLQPTAEGQESATDYEEDWDHEDWGSIETDENSSTRNSVMRPTDTSVSKSPDRGGTATKVQDGWDDWTLDEDEEVETEVGNSTRNAKNTPNDWGNEAWLENPEPIATTQLSKNDEMKKRREERKLLRQQELEVKRSSKSGPLKLGSKLAP